MGLSGKLIERLRAIIEKISIKDKIAIVHHTDPDGITSGVLAAKLIERLRHKQADVITNAGGGKAMIDEDTVNSVKGMDYVIITDIAAEQCEETIRKIAEKSQVIIIDHHKIYGELNEPKIFVIKPQLIGNYTGSDYPASKFVFDIGNLFVDMNDLDWIAGIGTIGDMCGKYWKEFIENTLKKYELETKENYMDTLLGKGASMISCAESYSHDNIELCFNIIYKAESINDVINSKIADYEKEIQRELDRLIELFEKDAIHKDDILFFEMSSKYKVKGPLSTILSVSHPNNTLIIADTSTDPIRVSARRQDGKVAVNDLLENAIKGIEGATGGGHKPAAAAAVPKSHYTEFKKRILC